MVTSFYFQYLCLLQHVKVVRHSLIISKCISPTLNLLQYYRDPLKIRFKRLYFLKAELYDTATLIKYYKQIYCVIILHMVTMFSIIASLVLLAVIWTAVVFSDFNYSTLFW